MATVFVDLDGTITQKDTYLPFLFHCAKRFGVKIGPTLLLPVFLLLYWVGLVTNSHLKEAFLRSVLAGISVEMLKPIVERYVAAVVEKGLNRSMVQAIQDHMSKGDRVALVTASFDLYVERLAEKLGIPDVVCTRAEVRDGMVTGRILGKNCHGPEKVQRLEHLLDPACWVGSILYTDHHSDLPLLKRVSRGFLVNPGFRTRALLKPYGFTFFHVSK